MTDEFDLALLAGNWGAGVDGVSASFAEAVAAVRFVPEPGTFGVLGLLIPVTLWRRS